MAKSKDFDNFATKVFRDSYGKEKPKLVHQSEMDDNRHPSPMPIDVIVVDKNDIILAVPRKAKLANSNLDQKSRRTDGRLTPVDVNLEENAGYSAEEHLTKGSKPQNRRTKQLRNDDNRQFGFSFDADDDKIVSSSDDSMSVRDYSSGTARNGTRLGKTPDGSDCEPDLVYFCVDHMKMCTSKKDRVKHKHCNVETLSRKSSGSRGSSKSPLSSGK